MLLKSKDIFCVSAIQVTHTQTVRLGEPIRLLCNVTGSRAKSRDVSWYRGSSAVQSDQSAGVQVTRRAIEEPRASQVTLLISSSGPRDAGVYTCRTSDRRLSASTFVHVNPDGIRQLIDQSFIIHLYTLEYSLIQEVVNMK